MPKKAHGRPSKSKARQRRAAARAAAVVSPPDAVDETAPVSVAEPVMQVPTLPTSTTTTARFPERRPTRGRVSPAAISFSYAYLRRDVFTLGVLGPAMIVLLIAAYVVFH